MIRVHQLTKRYGSTIALEQLTLEVPEGSVFGLLGPNGAGKTTLLSLIMGFAFPDAGQIDRKGLPHTRMGYLPERAFYPVRFTVLEYSTVLGRLAGLPAREARDQVRELLVRFGLHEVADRRLGACSRGMLQRLGLAQALLGDPPLILLDEPAQGLDPTGQKNMRDQILDLHQAGKTIILSSHRLDEVTRTCTHVGILRGGRLVLSGELETLLAARHAQPAAPEPAVPDDPHQVSITTTDLPPALIATLSSLAPGITIAKRGITLSGGAVDHKAHILRLLLDAGVDIQELGRKQATLEEVYLEATRE